MLEHRSASSTIGKYLRTTRGDLSDQLHHSNSELLQFFDDVVDSLRISKIEHSDIALTVIYSRKVDVEVLLSDSHTHIVFDQSITDLFRVLNLELFALLDRKAGWPGHSTKESNWLNALFANRYLSDGLNGEALVHALRILSQKDTQDSKMRNEKSAETWAKVQSAFALAHEVFHCRAEHSSSLASCFAADFERRLRPHMQHFDAKGGRDLLESDPDVVRERKLRLDEAAKRVEWSLSLMREMRENAPALFRSDPLLSEASVDGLIASIGEANNRTWEQRLDDVLLDKTGFGEEVLCDYAALHFVSRILGHSILPFDECLGACVAALRFLGINRMVEAMCHGYVDPTQISRVAEIRIESARRVQFIGMSAQVLFRNELEREFAAKSLTPESEEWRLANLEYNNRADEFNRHINLFAHAFATGMERELAMKTPGFAQGVVEKISKAKEYATLLRDPDDFARTVADISGIGPGLRDRNFSLIHR